LLPLRYLANGCGEDRSATFTGCCPPPYGSDICDTISRLAAIGRERGPKSHATRDKQKGRDRSRPLLISVVAKLTG
jgi:hypothetical protein